MAEAAVAAESAASAASAGGVAVAAAFSARGSAGPAPIRLSRSRYLRAAPNPAHRALLGRQWRCEELDCPAFGEHRQIGQPVPLLRDARATCPRHGVPLTDIGPRPPAYAVSIVVDDLPCRRLVVRHGAPVSVGSAERDPDVFSLAPWLHRAAVAWISPAHLRLEATAEGLVVTDHSRHGTVVWRRCGPHERGEARPMRHARYTLREWDSLELYTGIELVLGDQRLITLATQTEPVSVLIDAPTAALRQISTAAAGTGQSPTVQSPTVESPTGRAPTGRAQSGQAQNGQAQSGQAQNGQGPRGSSQKGQSGAAGQGTKPAAAADRWT